MSVIKKQLTKLVPSRIKKRIKLLTNKAFKEAEFEKNRLQGWPRYTETKVVFLNREIKITDIASFNFLKNELFDYQIYQFHSTTSKPYILDCGANIGLSIIYFKQLFPEAVIVGFEPDEKVFNALQFNVESFNLSDVTLIKKACWNEETTLEFYSEGADAGRILINSDTENIIEVQTVRLRDYLNRKVDFLKIDIEGAETKVLEDCSDLLSNVDKMFVEYHSFIMQDQTLGRLLQIIHDAGFRYQVQHIGVFSQHPFTNIKEYNNMDLQLNIFAFR